MKLELFSEIGSDAMLPAILTDSGVIDISSVVPTTSTPQRTMATLIDHFDSLRPRLEQLAADAPARPLQQVRLRPPLPRPGKVLCCIANYWEHAQREARPLNMCSSRTPTPPSAPATPSACPTSTCRGCSCMRPSWALCSKAQRATSHQPTGAPQFSATPA